MTLCEAYEEILPDVNSDGDFDGKIYYAHAEAVSKSNWHAGFQNAAAWNGSKAPKTPRAWFTATESLRTLPRVDRASAYPADDRHKKAARRLITITGPQCRGSKESASQAGDEHSSDSRESSAARWPGRPTSPTVQLLDPVTSDYSVRCRRGSYAAR
jgi:hypothetical protein